MYSPDRRWIALHFDPANGPRSLLLAPAASDGKAAPEREWIPVMDRPGIHTRPFWSPNGNVLYFLSTAGGDRSLWAQRLDRASKRPLGDPFVVYQPSAERRFQHGPWFGPALGPRQIIFPVIESTANIWLAE